MPLVSGESLRNLSGRLRSLLEPDYGLLDQLLGRRVLGREQYDVIRGITASVYQRNDQLLDYLSASDTDTEALMTALEQTDQWHVVNFIRHHPGKTSVIALSLGPFHGAIAVPSVTRCRCRCRRRCRGHRCAGGVRQWRRATVATPGEWQCKTASSGEWAQQFSNASCFV